MAPLKTKFIFQGLPLPWLGRKSKHLEWCDELLRHTWCSPNLSPPSTVWHVHSVWIDSKTHLSLNSLKGDYNSREIISIHFFQSQSFNQKLRKKNAKIPVSFLPNAIHSIPSMPRCLSFPTSFSSSSMFLGGLPNLDSQIPCCQSHGWPTWKMMGFPQTEKKRKLQMSKI